MSFTWYLGKCSTTEEPLSKRKAALSLPHLNLRKAGLSLSSFAKASPDTGHLVSFGSGSNFSTEEPAHTAWAPTARRGHHTETVDITQDFVAENNCSSQSDY